MRESELPGNRVLPLYLYVGGVDSERQLDIAVHTPWQTSQTRFDVEFYRLDVRDELSERLARAYQLLSQGHERQTVNSAANWSVRINMLLQAERSFADFGMEEHRLWAALSAAYLAHRELGESDLALDWVQRIIAAARLSAMAAPEFAATVLRGDILFRQARGDLDGMPDDVVQSSLSRTGALAEIRQNRYEQAVALFMSGEVYAERDELTAALKKYQQALDIALARKAMGLAADIRERMVAAHDRLGDVVASEQVLGSMVQQLASGGAQDELIRGLLAQGQLYLDLYRYPDAIAALQQALEVDDVSLTRTQASIMLGQALYESGRFQAAADLLEQALVNPRTGLFRRPNPLLPLNIGLQVLANVYRGQGRTEDARRVRLVQSRHLDGSEQAADWALQDVLDQVSAGDESAARESLRDNRTRLRSHAGSPWEELAALAMCAAFGPGRSPCTVNAVDAAHERVAQRAPPRMALATTVTRR